MRCLLSFSGERDVYSVSQLKATAFRGNPPEAEVNVDRRRDWPILKNRKTSGCALFSLPLSIVSSLVNVSKCYEWQVIEIARKLLVTPSNLKLPSQRPTISEFMS